MTLWPSLPKCVRFNIFLWTILLLSLRGEASSQQLIVLNVILNEETVGVSFLVKDGDDIWIKKEEIEKTKLMEGIGREIEFEGEKYISLKSISGIAFSIDEADASLKIKAAPHLFNKQSLPMRYERTYKVTYPSNNSAFLNYGILYDEGGPMTNFSLEAGVRVSDYLALSTFNYEKTEEDQKMVRLLTSVRTDNRKELTTLIIGDLTAEGGALGSSSTIGGIGFSKNYSINPYFLRYPALSLSGVIETPSELEIYVNDQLVGRRRINPGEFILTDVPATVGSGDAKIIIKDIYGRRTEIQSPFYYSDRLLKKGLHEYSYNIGLKREDLGSEDSSYGDAQLISFHNYGFSEGFKAGYAFEADPDVVNIGPTASFTLPFSGVINTALSLTSGEGKSGYGGVIDYLFQSKAATASLSIRSLSRDFSSLSVAPSDDKAKVQFNAAVGLSGNKALGGGSLSYSRSQMHIEEDTEMWTMSYNRLLLRDAALFAKVSTAKTGSDTEREAFLGLHIYLDNNTSGSLSYTDKEDDTIMKAGIQKNLPTATGFGYMAEEERHKDYTDRRAELLYQNDYGIYELDYANLDGSDSYSVLASGGIGYIDGTAFLSRPISDSFAKVKVGNLEGVGVSYYGNPVATTDSNGEAIIPVLQSFHDNRIGLDKDDIPIEYNVSAMSRYINPPYRSGSIVKFEVGKTQGFFGTVSVIADGKTTPVEFSILRIMPNGLPIEGLVGKRGEFYFENAPVGTHPAVVSHGGRDCEFTIIIPDSDEIMLNLGDLVCKFPE